MKKSKGVEKTAQPRDSQRTAESMRAVEKSALIWDNAVCLIRRIRDTTRIETFEDWRKKSREGTKNSSVAKGIKGVGPRGPWHGQRERPKPFL